MLTQERYAASGSGDADDLTPSHDSEEEDEEVGGRTKPGAYT
jgi:hypothetical protein